MTPCTRKAPGFRKGTRTAVSNGEPRKVVVCGTTVMRDRSLSPKATLTTTAGRVLPAKPKSISQTSPRRGVGIFLVEGLQQGGRSGADLLVLERTGIEGQGAAQDLVGKGAFFFRRQVFEGLQQGLGLAAHAPIVAKTLTCDRCAECSPRRGARYPKAEMRLADAIDALSRVIRSSKMLCIMAESTVTDPTESSTPVSRNEIM